MDAREKLILKYIKNKSVLDLGVGDVSYRFLHGFISDSARTCMGVELDPERAERLKKAGFNISVGNAETFNAGKKFDVVIAGDLIEHLDNPGLFIDNAMRHLKPGGYFIFNTPNIYSINSLLRGLFLGHVGMFAEHTMGFNEQLMRELLGRRDAKPEKVLYFTHKNWSAGSIVIRAMSLLNKEWHENIMFIIRKR